MATTFTWVRQRMVQAGHSGVSPADLLKELRESDVLRRGGTYQSFYRYFQMVKKLGWVQATPTTAPSYQRGVDHPGVLAPKRLYRITPLGVKAAPEDWSHPQAVLYPEYAKEGRWRKWFTPTYKQRGRPRKYPPYGEGETEGEKDVEEEE